MTTGKIQRTADAATWGKIQRTVEAATVMSRMGTWLTWWLICPTSFLRGFHRSQSEAEASAHWREPAVAGAVGNSNPAALAGWNPPELDV
jgi:hypothetical protein